MATEQTERIGRTANAQNVATVVLLAVMGLLLYILGGYRTEASEIKAQVVAEQVANADQEARLRVLESRWDDIRADLTEIKKAVRK